jgi:hypothetical protein
VVGCRGGAAGARSRALVGAGGVRYPHVTPRRGFPVMGGCRDDFETAVAGRDTARALTGDAGGPEPS